MTMNGGRYTTMATLVKMEIRISRICTSKCTFHDEVHNAMNNFCAKPHFLYLCRWLKVLDKDGNKTEHWNDWVERTNASLPNPGCCCLSNEEILENMVYPNKSQVVRFKRHS